MTATFRATPFPDAGPDGRLVEVDCVHGTTQVGYAPGPVEFNDQEFSRIALAKHHSEQPDCRCIAQLWHEHFTVPLGEMVLVRAGGAD